MKHVTYADKSLLIDDETADCLLEYASALGVLQNADTVTVKALSADGNEVEATFLLNASSAMIAETTNSLMEPPRNDAAVAAMRAKIDQLQHSPVAQEGDPFEEVHLVELDDLP